jgi:hypothetical protein
MSDADVRAPRLADLGQSDVGGARAADGAARPAGKRGASAGAAAARAAAAARSSGARPRAAHAWPRAANEWYVEPAWVTTALHAVDPLAGPTWDPACGTGHVVRSLRAAGVPAWGSDLVSREGCEGEWFAGRHDFLGELHPQHLGRPVRNIVTNPPFGRGRLAEAFARQAIATVTSGKVALFVDARFLGSAGRAHGLFAEHPPARVWLVTPRPSCPPGEYLAAGGKAEGGQADFVWIVWYGRTARGETRVDWIRRPTP